MECRAEQLGARHCYGTGVTAMHESLQLFDAAISLARQEADALIAEDEELQDQLCSERAELMARAWERRDGCDPAALEEKLLCLQQLQEKLSTQTQNAADLLREALKDARRQGTGISGYRKARAGTNSPVYLQRRS